MLTLSPPLFPSFGWPLVDDPNIISQDQNDTFVGNFDYIDTSFSNVLPSPQSTSFEPIGGDMNTSGVVKKLNHNASERDRRKRINNLYSSLFSLLPDAHRMKKLSIPATVACVVKYIPELQKEVESLAQKKEELSSRMCRQREDSEDYQVGKRRKVERKDTSLSAAVTVSPVGRNEVVVQISALKANKGLLSEALNKLELGDGLFLLNASSFQSIGDSTVFHSLHFQAQGKYELELHAIKEKIMLLYEKKMKVLF